MVKRFLGAGLLALFVMAGLAACSDSSVPVEAPAASNDTADASGYYCGMLLDEHEGPKGQVHLTNQTAPVWFSSVHDTIVFLRLPEEPRDIAAVYVHDMGGTQDWERPANVWVDAREAWFVVHSEKLGGMGTPEAVPFSSQDGAEAFIEAHGGELMRLDDIPDEYFSGLVEGGGPIHDGHAMHHDHDDSGSHDHSGEHDDSEDPTRHETHGTH